MCRLCVTCHSPAVNTHQIFHNPWNSLQSGVETEPKTETETETETEARNTLEPSNMAEHSPDRNPQSPNALT